MAPLLSFHPQQTLIPTSSLLSSRQIQTRIHFLGRPALFSRGSLSTRLGSSHYYYHHQLEELLSRADGFLYTIADAAVAAQESKPNEDWFSGIASYMEIILKVIFVISNNAKDRAKLVSFDVDEIEIFVNQLNYCIFNQWILASI